MNIVIWTKDPTFYYYFRLILLVSRSLILFTNQNRNGYCNFYFGLVDLKSFESFFLQSYHELGSLDQNFLIFYFSIFMKS